MKIDIQKIVEDTPNDMELGGKIRKMYWDRMDNINQLNQYKGPEWSGKIYESPDGGKTVYERSFGSDISERTLVTNQLNLFNETN
jgi:hypothetical protein